MSTTPTSINNLLEYTAEELNLEVLRRSYERTQKSIADLEATTNVLKRKQFAREREIAAAVERIAKTKEGAAK